MAIYYTTLNKIRACAPCTKGWSKLLKHLGKTKADDEPVSLQTILESNGLDDALWALRAVDGGEMDMRIFAVRCARKVQHLMEDARSLKALDVAEAYARGEATEEELAAAWAAAKAAARAAARVTSWAAAWAAAKAAARATSWAAAWDAAWAAAWDAARDAARDEQKVLFVEMFCSGESL